MDTMEADVRNVIREIKYYFLIMLLAIGIYTFFIPSMAVVWGINFIGLVLLFWHRLKELGVGWFRFDALYLFFSVLTFLINIDRFNGSIKSIGTNINLIVTPIYIILLFEYSSKKPFSDGAIFNLFDFISILGLFAVACAWITGYRDIIQVVSGRMNAYFAKASGLFYGKNIYGAFVSLSASVDLYQYDRSEKGKYLASFVLKTIAVMVSFSRAALLQAALFFFLFLWMNRRRAIHEWLLLFVGCVFFAVVILMNQQVLNKLVGTFIRFEAGDAGRAAERSRTLSIIGNSFWEVIFGVGFSGLDSLALDIDNTYFYIFFTGGLIKCIFFICLFIRFFFQFKQIRLDNEPLASFSLAIALSYLVYAFFESVSVFELGLLNYMFTFFIFLIPSGYDAGWMENEYSEEKRIED